MSKQMIKILNFAKGQEKPVFKENRNGQWIDYGEDNLYPQYLLDVYHNRSNKHKAIINKKVDMTTGNGIVEYQSEEFKRFMTNRFSDYDMEELSVKWDYDLEIYGGFAALIRWSLDGTRIAAIDYMPFQKLRLSTDDDYVLFSKDWKKYRKNENKPYEILKFDPLKAKENPKQIFYFTLDSVGQEYYPIPYYSSTLTWIELDFEIGNFHLSSVRNGFMPSFILNFATGIPTQEEMDMAYREFERKYTGTENAGKFILTFSNGGDEAPTLEAINLNDSDERFVMLHKEMRDEIFIGHSVTNPQLFGIRVAGELGGKDELLESLAIFNSTYVKSKQKVISKQIEKLARWSGVNVETEPIEFNQYEIDFGNIESEVAEQPAEEQNNVQ